MTPVRSLHTQSRCPRPGLLCRFLRYRLIHRNPGGRTVQCLLLAMLILVGCTATAPTPAPTGPKFGGSRLPLDSVALEVGLVQLDDSQGAVLEQLWQTLDHQKLDLATRKKLDRNGMRLAILPSNPPASFFKLIEPRPLILESLSAIEESLAAEGRLEPKSRMLIHQRITNRQGEGYEIQTSDVYPEIDWVQYQGSSSIPGSGKLVKGIFEIGTNPNGDGSVQIRLTPKINHGEASTSIGVSDRAYAYDVRQATRPFADLIINLNLRPGETVIVAPTSDLLDLGMLFFGAPIREDHELRTPNHLTHRILLVRVVQTQLDDLFGKSIPLAPLSTATLQ